MAESTSGWWSWFSDTLAYLGVPAGLVATVTGWSTWFLGITTFLGTAGATVFWTLVGRHYLCWIEWVICWLVRSLYYWSLPPVTAVLKWMPAMPELVLTPAVNMWKFANYWTPLNETVLAVFVCWYIVFTFRVVRFIKSWIPTESS